MNIDIQKELREILRPHNGWTQKSLAEHLNISPQYLNDVLHGKREPGKKILDGLNIKKVVLYRYKEAALAEEGDE